MFHHPVFVLLIFFNKNFEGHLDQPLYLYGIDLEWVWIRHEPHEGMDNII
jgi:hypothetical protein